MQRRNFLFGSAAAAAIAGGSLSLVFSRRARAGEGAGLVPDPAGILDLPPGYTYRILEQRGDPMDDGYRVPGRPDGMACFPGEAPGTLIIMRNHELSPSDKPLSPYKVGQTPPKEAYDAESKGGVSRLVVDAKTFERISSNLVLAGTNRNCAGGTSPFGWLSCEEDLGEGHGYVFLCRLDAETVQAPERIPAYGRFNHEAAAIDPETMIAYLTEDRDDGCFYRFVPASKEAPFEGTLQALAIEGQPRFETFAAMSVGDRLPVVWVDVDAPDPADDSVRKEAQSKGAAIVRRGEGIVLAEGAVYVCATTGGPVGGGQIFRLNLVSAESAENEAETLELLCQSTDRARLDMPDNITLAPSGDLYMSEDGKDGNCVRVLAPDGTVHDFARNAKGFGELTGVCFSPEGDALFLNIQVEGLTLVVTGPFAPAPFPLAPPGSGGSGGGPDATGSGGDSAAPAPPEESGCSVAGPPPASLPATVATLGLLAALKLRARR